FRFFFQAEDGIRDDLVTGVQTCALPISGRRVVCWRAALGAASVVGLVGAAVALPLGLHYLGHPEDWIGRADQVSVMNAIRTGARSEERRVGEEYRSTWEWDEMSNEVIDA